MKAQEKEQERMMSMLQDAHRARAYQTELALVKDVLQKLLARIDAACDGKLPDSKSRRDVEDEEYWKMVERYKTDKCTVGEIAEEFDRSHTVVRQVLIRQGVYKPGRDKPGAKKKTKGAKR